MKKISVLILSLIMIVSGLTVTAWAFDGEGDIAVVNIAKDSKLILDCEDEYYEIPMAEKLGYYELVLPYGTDLSKVKFGFDITKIYMELTEESAKVWNIKSEDVPKYESAIKGYFFERGKAVFCIGEDEYESYYMYDTIELEEGKTYTVSLEDHGWANAKDGYNYIGSCYYEIQEGAKFAFKVRINEENAKIIEGSNFEFKEGQSEGCVIRIDEDFDKFTGVECNGELLEKDVDYTVKSGSTIITLSDKYLNSLSEGTYTIKALFSNCESDAVTINVMAETVEPPITGDCNMAVLLVTLAASAMILAGTALKRKYETQ